MKIRRLLLRILRGTDAVHLVKLDAADRNHPKPKR
jgi:hypothetical protein